MLLSTRSAFSLLMFVNIFVFWDLRFALLILYLRCFHFLELNWKCAEMHGKRVTVAY